ncbi:MAG: hypothetical protein ACRD1X_03240 [Vicinamibacteria bacterium]
MARRALILMLLALMVAGCAITYGREFDTTKVSQIQKGKTVRGPGDAW